MSQGIVRSYDEDHKGLIFYSQLIDLDMKFLHGLKVLKYVKIENYC